MHREESIPDDRGDPDRALLQWLLRQRAGNPDPESLLARLAERLTAAGLPLDRVIVELDVLDPLTRKVRAVWTRQDGSLTVVRHPHGESDERLSGDHVGTPKYAPPASWSIVPIGVGSGSGGTIMFETERHGGFVRRERQRLRCIALHLAPVLETHYLRRVCGSLLETYVGHVAGERVLRGQVRRGHFEPMSGVLWLSDLRGFTRLSHVEEPLELAASLESYLGAVVESLAAEGGEVVKYIGDGVLALFPTGTDGIGAVAEHAARAADRTTERLARVSRTRHEPLRASIALHVGEMLFGNVGAMGRLDFTVIGRDVNLLARLGAAAKRFETPVAMSPRFADVSVRPKRLLAELSLRDIPAPQRVYGFASDVPPEGGRTLRTPRVSETLDG